VEAAILAALAAAALVLLGRAPRRGLRKRVCIALGVVAGLSVSCLLWRGRVEEQVRARAKLLASIPTAIPADRYVSSDKCQACHPGEYATWHRSFHRTMTQVASPQSVLADFENVTLEVEGEPVHLERRGDEFWADMVDPDWKHDQALAEWEFKTGRRASLLPPVASPPRVRKRIGMLTGSHHFQAFWVPSSRAGNLQFAFPFAWLIEEQRWVPRRDTFVRDPRARSPVQIWNRNCIQCHSTAGQPRDDSRSTKPASRAAELGIACEACHGPAEQHVQQHANPWQRLKSHMDRRSHPESAHSSDGRVTSALTSGAAILNPKHLPHERSTQVCGQCHAVKWHLDREAWLRSGAAYKPGDDLDETSPLIRPRKFPEQTWLPEYLKTDHEFLGGMFWPDGIIRVTGREFNGLIESACYQRGQVSCLSCHSMHQSDPNDQLAAGMNGNQACLQCHARYAENLAAHTHHKPDSPGSQCYNCHMPFDTYGLLKAVRSHHIASPSVTVDQQTGRPNACNLCHLDQSLAWTASYLKTWYDASPPTLSNEDQTVAAAVLWTLRGEAGLRALVAWHMGWADAQKTAGEWWLAPYLTQLMEDPYSAVRYIAHRSLRRLAGYEDLAFDFVGPEPQRRAAVQQALLRWERAAARTADHGNSALLIGADGRLQRETLARWLAQRDERSLDLIE
jgi:predicted CXXCH cytochrome family protein